MSSRRPAAAADEHRSVAGRVARQPASEPQPGARTEVVRGASASSSCGAARTARLDCAGKAPKESAQPGLLGGGGLPEGGAACRQGSRAVGGMGAAVATSAAAAWAWRIAGCRGEGCPAGACLGDGGLGLRSLCTGAVAAKAWLSSTGLGVNCLCSGRLSCGTVGKRPSSSLGNRMPARRSDSSAGGNEDCGGEHVRLHCLASTASCCGAGSCRRAERSRRSRSHFCRHSRSAQSPRNSSSACRPRRLFCLMRSSR